MSDTYKMSRRDMLIYGSAAAAGLAFFSSEALAKLLQLGKDERPVPWLAPDQPVSARAGVQLDWDNLDSWITPADQFFVASHYPEPDVDPVTYRLDLTGLVKRSRSFTLGDIKAMPKKEIIFTLECSGNAAFPQFMGGVYNARWTGTPLAPILNEAGIMDDAIDVVFFGYDEGEETVQPRARQQVTMKQNFARSLTVEQALDPNILLCYEVNGQPLPKGNGFPVRLIVPDWYGIANVKWLKRIELRSTRYMGRFISRDYVTIREEKHNGETVWTQTSVGKGRINSMPAKITRIGTTYRIYGAAWGAPIKQVQVRIDDGAWRAAEIIEGQNEKHAWKFWRLEWDNPANGKHTVTSRAVSNTGAVQPAADDPYLTRKHTYWESNGQVTREVRISKV